MMPDIFSTFDPHISSTLLPIKSVFLLLTPMLIAIMLASLFTSNSRLLAVFMATMDVMYSQLARTLSSSLKGITFIVSSTFMLIISLNLMGLVPYCFSLSSHLIMTLSLGLPLWLSLIISSLVFKPKATTAHFLPDGAPDWLNPFLVLIESSSVLVRPLTLSFRLAANMTAGHIVLSLLGIYMSAALFTSTLSSFILLLTSSFYILFEIAICMIQAYIFCLLVSLYSDDHAH